MAGKTTKNAETKNAETKAESKAGTKTGATAVKTRESSKTSTARVPAQKKVNGDRRARLEKTAAALSVREGESAWTVEEVREVHAALIAEGEQLRSQISAADLEFSDLLWSPGDGAGDDQADAGSKTFEREHEMSLAANARDLLAQVERAVALIADGRYGSCENCRQAIGKARLQAYPRATLCVTCKQREERR